MVIVYGFTGTTSLEEIASVWNKYRVPADNIPFGSNAMIFGVILIIAGFGFKIAVFPFHMWAPDVYEGAPTPITAFLSVASKAAGFAVVLRVFYTGLGVPDISAEWSIVFAVMSACSMTIGNLIAIRQKDIKRLLAYSTIAHAGYILVGVASINGDIIGSSAVLFYLSGYAATNLAAFTVVIAISGRIGSFAIDDFAGMARRAPYLSAVLAFSMVSLIGLPPAVGFVTKMYIFGSALESNLEWLAVVGVANSVVSAYYYLRVVKVMYLSPANSEDPIQVGLSMKVATIVSFVGLLGFGLYPTPLLKLAAAAAVGIVT
jgi:NADH-quinone oxidoreductase subunit N